MVSRMVPVLALLTGSVFAGCSAGGSNGSADSHNNAGNPATTGGSTSVTRGGTAGVVGSDSAGNASVSGSGGAVAGSGGGSGLAGAASGGSGGAAGTGGSGSAHMPLFSDDFEGATISSKWTPRINSTAMFDLDTSQKHSGKQSLHLKHSGFSSMLAAEGAPVFPALNNTFYARLWLRVASDMGALPQGHVVWFETGDVTNDTHEVRVGANLGKFQSNLYYQGEVDIRDPQANMTTDAWHCIQAKYGNDVLEVSLDGVKSAISTTNWVAADSVNGNNVAKTNWSPTYAAFRIGWELGTGEIWYDDVALDSAEIPCQ